MKARGGYLSKVMKYFSEHKNEMLGEDKKMCYERIQEIKEQHERFWANIESLRKRDVGNDLNVVELILKGIARNIEILPRLLNGSARRH
jgi:hypothetical protein